MNSTLIEEALGLGFSAAGIMSVSDFKIVPEYRSICEDNSCGNYNKLKSCPPACGTVSEMTARIRKYEHALVLQTEIEVDDLYDPAVSKQMKHDHNVMTDELLAKLGLSDYLLISAGPWKNNSCMSAYCVDAQAMAEAVGMKCWENDSFLRFFSAILFH